jgi:hypothetical protein
MPKELSPVLNGRPLRPGHPLYDAEKTLDLAQTVKRIAGHRVKGAVALWDEGRAFSHIKALKLYIQDGYSGFGPWVEQKLGRSYSWVRELIQLADNHPRPEVVKHGRRKLALGEEYVRLTATRSDKAWALAGLKVTVPIGDDRTTAVEFAEVTEQQLVAANEHQRALAERRRKDDIPDEQQHLANRIETILAAHMEDVGRPEDGRVTVRPSSDGDAAKTMVSLSLPLEEFVRVMKKFAASR